MKKIFLTAVMIIFSSGFLISGLLYDVKAADDPGTNGGSGVSSTGTISTSIPCPLPAELCDARSAISVLTKLIVPAAALILLLMLIYAGFTKLTAAGDAEKEKKAMQILQAALLAMDI